MSKWLILRAREPADVGVGPCAGKGDSSLGQPVRETGRRSPTGQPALPCDWLFSVAVEAVVIVQAGTRRVVQANPAATALLGISPAALIGARFVDAFDSLGANSLAQAMDEAQILGAADDVTCRSAEQAVDLTAKVSLFRAEEESFLLVRLAAMSDDSRQNEAESPVFDAIESAAVGFVLTDAGLRVEYANQALTEMAGLTPPAAMSGCSLVRWLEFSADDLTRLRDQMSRRQATSIMTARLRPDRGSPLEVEVCAVAVPDGPQICWGFTIRELPRLN
jgi:PAS domain-containing protein